MGSQGSKTPVSKHNFLIASLRLKAGCTYMHAGCSEDVVLVGAGFVATRK